MTSSQKRNHDNFFRTIFADPKNTANLISLAAKNNPNLKELLDLINLETLQEISGAATREGASGSGDLTFKVEIKNPAKNKRRNHSHVENEIDSISKSNRPDQLLVGLILEHKSYRDSKIRNQLLKYYFEVMHQKAGNIPAVAIIVYNGRDKWNPLKIKPHPGYPEFFQKVGLPFRVEFIDLGREPVDFSNLDPLLALAIAAMRMVFDAYGAEKYFKTALRRLLKSKQNFRSIVEEILVYLRGMLPEEEKEMIMDSLEVIQNKGYVS
ncbi:MAG: Rpn family recombination-promoting nuclease/putative transposase, partial [Fibrobacteraceae bacterium]|nr:Rpn family recombination-promoting nuclease/putative transposase [Fibrobacteraceae bacterium]